MAFAMKGKVLVIDKAKVITSQVVSTGISLLDSMQNMAPGTVACLFVRLVIVRCICTVYVRSSMYICNNIGTCMSTGIANSLQVAY